MGVVNRLPLTVVIITKNEAEAIGTCIKYITQLKPEEILVIDDNSTDETRKHARHMGARVVLHKKKHFAEIRNFAISQVKSKWILYIDADEVVTQELAQELQKVIEQSVACQAYSMIRINYYLGKKWPYREKVTRLFKTSSIQGWFGELHESPRIYGKIQELSSTLLHYTHQSMFEMVENTNVWSDIEAKLRFKTAHPPIFWWRIPRVMLPVFVNYYFFQGGWRVGTVGLIESMYQAFSIFITYARLWEIQHLPEASVY